MDNSAFRIDRARRWLGWTNRQPSVSVTFRDDAVWMLALRDRPLRVTACGTVELSVGTVRHGEPRLVGLVGDALRSLRVHLLLPEDPPVVAVVAPSAATVDAESDTINAWMDNRQVDALTRSLQEAGFTQARLDPVPAALARLGRLLAGSAGHAAGAGWSTGWAGEVSDAAPSGTAWDPVSVGAGPTSLLPVASPQPIGIDPAVALVGPWSLLLGGALASFEHGPASVMSGVAQPAFSGWAAEPIGADLS